LILPGVQQEILVFKVVVIGDKNVGKTSLVNRYTEDKFSDQVDSTIGAYFSSKVIEFNVNS